MKKSSDWNDYKIIDAGLGEKLEIWNGVILRRPDPQAIWPREETADWNNYDGFYHRSNKGGGNWEYKKKLPEYWTVSYKDLIFKVSPTNFKHTGLFPEQAVNWDYMMEKIKSSSKKVKVLNLFAYTGAASIACAKAGAHVTHVDSAKGMIDWAKDNANLSKIDESSIRYIVDDCLKFVLREARRNVTYDAIIMDPPSFGRGPSGEIWKFEEKICELIEACTKILSEDPLFMTINTYTTGISKTVVENVLKLTVSKKFPNGKIEADEIGLNIEKNSLVLPCGIYARWESNK